MYIACKCLFEAHLNFADSWASFKEIVSYIIFLSAKYTFHGGQIEGAARAHLNIMKILQKHNTIPSE